MNTRLLLCRRMLLVCAFLIVSVALLIALIVIPAVESDTYLGANPERSVQGFWFNFGLSLFSSVACVAIALWSKERFWISTSILVVIGLVVLGLGLALADAASAFRSHGPSMQSVSILLFICAAADFLAGALAVTAAFLRPRRVGAG